MSDFGIVSTGFKKKRYVDILGDMQARARANFGDTIVTDTNKPMGKIMDIFAWALSELWEELEETYNSIAIDTASNIALDRIVKYKGLRREAESFATTTIKIFGNEGVVVPVGFIVGKLDGTTYSNSTSGTIGILGYIELPYICNFAGTRGNAEVGEISQIITPITGITSVTNSNLVQNGNDYEVDAVLRQRYIDTVGGLSTVDSIRAAVMNVEGVVSVLVIENPENEVDEYGNPPKSFQTFVYGGEDMDIGQSILDSKAAGIQAYGQTIVEPMDDNGYTHKIGFTRVAGIEITVKVEVTRNQFWPIDGIERIMENIIEYIGGENSEGTQFGGLKVNQPVINSYVSSLVWPVGGVTDVKVTMSRGGEPLSGDNILIGEFEKAITNPTLIEVVI